MTRHLGKNHELYVENHTVLLANVFENFQSMCYEIYEFPPAHFLTTRIRIKTRISIGSSRNKLMLSIGRKRNHRCGTCYLIRRYVKSNNKFMKNHDKNKELLYLKYWDSNSLHG